MENILMPREICEQVLMIGVYYKNNAPGGMAAVIQYYEKYFEKLHYISSWKDACKITKLYYYIKAYTICLINLIFNPKIRVIHIHTAADNSFWRKTKFIKLAKHFNKKVIIHVHASRFKDFYNESTQKEKIKKYLNMTDKIIVLSNSWRDWFINIGIDSTKIIVLNNIVTYPKIQQIKEDANKIKMLFLGEIGKRKGVFDILTAIARNSNYYKDKIIFKIGGNKNEEQLQSFIQSNNLQSFVKFEGWIAGEKKEKLLNWADIFILPSYNEGLPIAILEAMSYHTAIISSPVGGIPEIITHNKNGILVTPGNTKEIDEAIKYCINNPQQLQCFKTTNQTIIKEFYPDFVLNHLKQIYTSLLL